MNATEETLRTIADQLAPATVPIGSAGTLVSQGATAIAADEGAWHVKSVPEAGQGVSTAAAAAISLVVGQPGSSPAYISASNTSGSTAYAQVHNAPDQASCSATTLVDMRAVASHNAAEFRYPIKSNLFQEGCVVLFSTVDTGTTLATAIGRFCAQTYP